MKKQNGNRGALSIEASISYSIFLMIIVTILYIMRIVYAYGLMQHAVSQAAKELSMYTYIYQISGMNEAYQSVGSATADRTEQFDKDAENIISMYEKLSNGDRNIVQEASELTINPVEILKNVGSVMLGNAADEVNQKAFEAIARPMIAGYIAKDSGENSADERLKKLRVINGLSGVDLSSSSFFKDGETIDLIACYTIDPVMPIDIMPELNLANRACIRGMSGKSVFSYTPGSKKEESTTSVWDNENDLERGKKIQAQEGVRNLPDGFKTFSAFDPASGKATAEMSMDLRENSYQTESGIKQQIRSKCNKMMNYRTATYDGVTLEASQIRSKELIIYIPSSAKERTIDRTAYDQAIREIRDSYPDINIVTKELD